MVKEMDARLQYQGMKFDQYLKLIGKTMEDFKKENEEQAKSSVKTKLVLEAIIKAEKIEADEETINTKLKEMSELYGRKEEELKENQNFMNYLEDSIKNEKVIDFIINNAKIK